MVRFEAASTIVLAQHEREQQQKHIQHAVRRLNTRWFQVNPRLILDQQTAMNAIGFSHQIQAGNQMASRCLIGRESPSTPTVIK